MSEESETDNRTIRRLMVLGMDALLAGVTDYRMSWCTVLLYAFSLL
jgi:hypothetical protein